MIILFYNSEYVQKCRIYPLPNKESDWLPIVRVVEDTAENENDEELWKASSLIYKEMARVIYEKWGKSDYYPTESEIAEVSELGMNY